MINAKKVLAIIPARGGSKGIPLKNLREIGGKSLVAHAAQCAKSVNEIDRCVVSTDHDEIASEALKYGVGAPFKRPTELSGDRVGDFEVLEHALLAMEGHDGSNYDIIVMLQPTSPLRKPTQVSQAIKMMVENELDAVWSVSPTDLKFHPLKQLQLENGELNFCSGEGDKIIARQQLTPSYHRNGVVYVFTRSCLLDQRKILGERTGALVIDEKNISIDTVQDLTEVEVLMGQRRSSRENI